MKHIRPAIFLVLVFTLLAGFAFPALIRVVSMVAFPKQAEGSLLTDKSGKVIGSELIGQQFSDPKYFHPRPSAAGNGYDPTSSGGTNLGPTSDKLINGIHKKTADGKDDPSNFDGIADLAKAYRKENGLSDNQELPSDAVTRSASGLDPEISPENARLQADRVAKARGMSAEAVNKLVETATDGRFIGIYGDPRVNVIKLNLALDNQKTTS